MAAVAKAPPGEGGYACGDCRARPSRKLKVRNGVAVKVVTDNVAILRRGKGREVVHSGETAAEIELMRSDRLDCVAGGAEISLSRPGIK